MKIRLAIAAGPDQPSTFEHSGPVLVIGRDAECDLALQGQASTGVSRQHVHIELHPGGATIQDAGSSNGTLLNGQLVNQVSPLRVGDQIGLGYTGPRITVVELDLGKPLVQRLRRLPVLGVVAAAAAVVLVVVMAAVPFAVIALQKSSSSSSTEALATQPAPNPPPVEPSQPPLVPDKPTNGKPEIKKPEVKKPEVKKPEPSGTPNLDVQKIGSYVVLKNWVSVLLGREGEDRPWGVMAPEARVATAQTLVSLPGYRSLVVLDKGVHLTLWGNLPEFSSRPPVFESVVMLHPPTADTDLDFTLDRGRVVIANRKNPAGPAHVRLRFLRETWDLELPTDRSEVAVELWSPPPERTPGAERSRLSTILGLFTKGPVAVNTGRDRRDLPDRSRLSWVNEEPTTLYQSPLKEYPDWWAKPPDRDAPAVQKALGSLLDWSVLLRPAASGDPKRPAPTQDTEPLVSRIKKQVQDVPDPDDQDVGVLFLAALDEVEPLIDLLSGNEGKPNVRSVARMLLQGWLGRSSEHAQELAQILERRGTSRDEAGLIVGLLHVYSKKATNDRKTYEELVQQLDNGNSLVRDLAFWQLDQLGLGGHLPEEAKRIRYDPTWDAVQRRPAIEEWNKLVAEGKLPARANR
jgi:hypothetical protein